VIWGAVIEKIETVEVKFRLSQMNIEMCSGGGKCFS